MQVCQLKLCTSINGTRNTAVAAGGWGWRCRCYWLVSTLRLSLLAAPASPGVVKRTPHWSHSKPNISTCVPFLFVCGLDCSVWRPTTPPIHIPHLGSTLILSLPPSRCATMATTIIMPLPPLPGGEGCRAKKSSWPLKREWKLTTILLGRSSLDLGEMWLVDTEDISHGYLLGWPLVVRVSWSEEISWTQ